MLKLQEEIAVMKQTSDECWNNFLVLQPEIKMWQYILTEHKSFFWDQGSSPVVTQFPVITGLSSL